MNFNISGQDKMMRDMTAIVITRFRRFLKEKGYKFTEVTLPYGALPPNRNAINTVIVVQNPDAALKTLLTRYDIEYNHRRNYFYRNEWTDSSVSRDMSIHIHTYTDIYKLNVLLAKE